MGKKVAASLAVAALSPVVVGAAAELVLRAWERHEIRLLAKQRSLRQIEEDLRQHRMFIRTIREAAWAYRDESKGMQLILETLAKFESDWEKKLERRGGST